MQTGCYRILRGYYRAAINDRVRVSAFALAAGQIDVGRQFRVGFDGALEFVGRPVVAAFIF